MGPINRDDPHGGDAAYALLNQSNTMDARASMHVQYHVCRIVNADSTHWKPIVASRTGIWSGRTS